MKKQQFLQLRFFADTCLHYTSKNRGTNKEGRCRYAAGCAVGRHIRNKKLARKLDKAGNSSVDNLSIFLSLTPKLRKLGMEFLAAMQRFHDAPECWCETGLTERGEQRANTILRNITSGGYLTK